MFLHTLTLVDNTKVDERVQRSKDDVRLDHTIVVQLAQVLHTAHTPLVEFWMIYFHANSNIFQQSVSYAHSHTLLVRS